MHAAIIDKLESKIVYKPVGATLFKYGDHPNVTLLVLVILSVQCLMAAAMTNFTAK